MNTKVQASTVPSGGAFYIKILHSSTELPLSEFSRKGRERTSRRGQADERVGRGKCEFTVSAMLLFILQICPLIPGGKVCFWEEVSTVNKLLGTFSPLKYRLEVQADQRLLLNLAYTWKYSFIRVPENLSE